MREPFPQRLEKKIIVCGGAMGTMLYAKGIPLSHCYDELNVSMPQAVKDVHLAYVKAGARDIGVDLVCRRSERNAQLEQFAREVVPLLRG